MELHNQSFIEFIGIIVSACFAFVFGHNLWLVARDETDEINIEVVTGDKFPESDTAVKTSRIVNFCGFSGEGVSEIDDFQIKENLLTAKVKKDVQTVALELFPHPIELAAEKFISYIKSEDVENFAEVRSSAPQREEYSKFAKVFINNESFASIVGHKFEIIFQSDPLNTKTGEKLKVKVLFENKPLKDLRVSIGAENLNGGKYLAHSRTDENGLVEIEISGEGLWFVRTHYIRPHADAEKFDWESFWTSITFRI